MNYELKDKINATPEFLGELEAKSWLEIEHLQAQIANLAEGPANEKLRKLFKNLLTSYYVFTGELENLSSGDTAAVPENDEPGIEYFEPEVSVDQHIEDTEESTEPSATMPEIEVIEPFEYFIDFDDPVGEPLSDEDLYGN